MGPVELNLVRIIKVLEKLEGDHGDAAWASAWGARARKRSSWCSS